MKILLTVHQFFPQYAAGTEVLTCSVARELMKRGHTVHVLSGHPNSAFLRDEDRLDEYDFEGIHVYRFHHDYKPMAGQTSVIELDYNNRLAAKYFGLVLEMFKPDVVHFFHLHRLGTGLIEQAVRLSIPCFMTPTDFWSICPTGQLLCSDGSLCLGPSVHAGNCLKCFAQKTRRVVFRIIAKSLPNVVADLLAQLTHKGILPSYRQREEVMAVAFRLGINIARLNQLNGLIVPNGFMRELLIRHGVSSRLIIQSAFGIDLPYSALVERRSIPRHPLRIGFIGSHNPQKGCHVLIEAFKALPSGQAILKIYGNNIREYPEYSRMLKRLSCNNDAIDFCGIFHNSKIREVLADLDVLVVPSLWYENTPLVVYSAQAARCPVVASDFPGLSEVIRDQVNGLLFEAGNHAALTKQLSRLINESGLVERLSINARHPKSTVIYVDELLSIWGNA
jgi:glycosyltransferase involved in cell wall biosynthesis